LKSRIHTDVYYTIVILIVYLFVVIKTIRFIPLFTYGLLKETFCNCGLYNRRVRMVANSKLQSTWKEVVFTAVRDTTPILLGTE